MIGSSQNIEAAGENLYNDSMHQIQLSYLQKMIEENPSLIWYTKNYTSLNDEAIAEALYNFGSWKTIQEFHKTVGLSQAKAIFYRLNTKQRPNRTQLFHPLL